MTAAVNALDLGAYQRAARTVLLSPLITETYPDGQALPLVRRWAAPLRNDLERLFGYQLHLTPTTARLVRARDGLDPTHPALAGATGDRPFDRRRYAYLSLLLSVLGRAGTQIALSEMADQVAAEAARIEGLELSPERAADRAAFVDTVGWLSTRGAVSLADGNARRWADDPSAGEALYDIDRDVLRALYRPSRILQHIDSVGDLLVRSDAVSRDTRRREAGQRVRRLLVERPVVYFDDLDPADHGALRNPAAATDVAAFTGMVIERRAEGVALLDVSGVFSDRRFPGSGTVAQVAFLLANRIADRILDPDAAELLRLQAPEPGVAQAFLRSRLDSARPGGTGVQLLNERPEARAEDADENPVDDAIELLRHPLIESSWLTTTMSELTRSYGTTFAAAWLADEPRLLTAAITLLTELNMVTPVPGGVLARPLLARYRNAVVSINKRAGLFDL